MKAPTRYLALSIIVVVALAVFLVMKIGDNPFGVAQTFHVKFEEVRGIREGSKVTYLGLPAGYVSKIRVTLEDDRPVVITTIAITRAKLAILANVKARVTPTILGESMIALTLPKGNLNTATLANNAVLRGTVGSAIESIVPEFDDMMKKVAEAEPTVAMLGDLLKSSINQLRELFLDEDENRQTEFDRLTGRIKEVSGSVVGPEKEDLKKKLEGLVSDMAKTSENLRKLTTDESPDPTTLPEIMAKFSAVLDSAKQMEVKADRAEKILRKLGADGDKVAGDVHDARSKIVDLQPTGIGKWFYRFAGDKEKTPIAERAATPGVKRPGLGGKQ